MQSAMSRTLMAAVLVVAFLGLTSGFAESGYCLDRTVSDPSVAQPISGVWVPTGDLNVWRERASATLLPNGKVLVAGGENGLEDNASGSTSAELYDPGTGLWALTGALETARKGHTATLLPNGKVLVVGGDAQNSPESLGDLGTAELYDPTSATWSRTGSLNTPRGGFSATLLRTGKVLVAGGVDNLDNSLSSAELYDPATGKWTFTGNLITARVFHTATPLLDGRVLIIAGWTDDFLQIAISTVELYDPLAGTWSSAAGLAQARAFHTATKLQDGKVVVAGGYLASPPSGGGGKYVPTSLDEVELYDPANDKWNTVGKLNSARNSHTATLLADGEVLVAGGEEFASPSPPRSLNSAELYDPSTSTWRLTAAMGTTLTGAATLLADGAVLVTGGNTAELYLPASLPAGTIGAGYTGAWYDPAQSGHGLMIEILPDNRFYASWFAFNPSGTQQAWFTGVGTYSGNTATITQVTLPTGGRWIPHFDPNQVAHVPWGTLTFTFSDCDHGVVDFNSIDGYGSGSMSLTRLTQPAGLACR